MLIYYVTSKHRKQENMEGVLYKWTNYISGWQPRWFVLEGGTLSYYDSQEDAWKGCKGSIKISVCEIQVHPSDLTRVDLLVPGEQHFYLRTLTAADRQRWLVALGTAKACLTDYHTHREKELQESTEALKTKVCELRLYCELLLQQVNNIKQSPDGQHTEVKSTCSTFLKTLEECMQIAGRTFSPDHKVKPVNQTSPNQTSPNLGHRKRETSSSSPSDLIGPPPSPGSRPPDAEHTHVTGAQDTHTHPSVKETPESVGHTHNQEEGGPREHGHTHNQEEGGPREHGHTHNQEEGGPREHGYTHNQEQGGPREHGHTYNQEEGGTREHGHTHNQEEGGTREDDHTHTQEEGGAREDDHSHGQDEGGARDHTQNQEEAAEAGPGEGGSQSEGAEEEGEEHVETFFSSMSHRFSDITLEEDAGIPTQPFLDSCYAIVPVLDKLGPTVFAPVKIDFVGNIKKIQQKLQSDPDTFPTLQAMVLHELHTQQAQVRNSATEALLWLKRGLHFLLEFLTQVNAGEQDIHAALNNAYGRTLRQYHGWVVRGVFALALRAAPSYGAFAAALVMREGEEQRAGFSAGMRRDLDIYLPAMKTQLSILDALYHTHSLESDEVV
ncbi:hypothetical protein ACEWY4_027720 [Coilia grayii]|uniref:Pleckstrin homology domain-containing family A member 8 n=1 Tax=Coilia grayii TaxID=363190 RepID=A0ABD1IRQ6_9TELE